MEAPKSLNTSEVSLTEILDRVQNILREKFSSEIEKKYKELGREIPEKSEVNAVIKRESRHIESALYQARKYFENIFRDTGEQYIMHLIGALEEYINHYISYDENCSWIEFIRQQINTAALMPQHDTLEDKDMSFTSLLHARVLPLEGALAVKLMAKPYIKEVIKPKNNEKEKEEYNILRNLYKIGFLNDKFHISDKTNLRFFLNKIQNLEEMLQYYPEYSNIKDLSLIKNIIYGSEKYDLTKSDKENIKIYNQIKKEYKKRQKEEYYHRFSLDNKGEMSPMFQYAKKLNKKHSLRLGDEELKSICRSTIYGKICDRYNNIINLTEEWGDRPWKVLAKIRETEELLPIFKKVSPKAYDKIYKVLSKQKFLLLEVLNTYESTPTGVDIETIKILQEELDIEAQSIQIKRKVQDTLPK